MRMMKTPQFVQNGIGLLEARMTHRLVPRYAGQSQAAESLGDLDATGTFIPAPCFIHFGLAAVISAMAGQVVGDPEG